MCIANWNCRDLLRNCLRSLEQARGVSLEVIVVDNGSGDGAAEMVAREFPRVRLIRNAENIGFASANNQATRAARGDLLLFLNNDTVVPAGSVSQLADHLHRDRETIVVGPRLVDGAGQTQVSHRRRPTIATFLHRTLLLRWTGLLRGSYRTYRRAPLATRHSALATDVLMGAALMVRRKEFLRLGAWDEDFSFGGEDLELCYRANQIGQVMYLPNVSITHFGRASTRQNIAFASPRIAAGFVQYFRKSGASRAGLFIYKLGITLDAPLQMIVKSGQYLVRRVRGRKEAAERTLTALRGLWSFLATGLWRFWRA